MGVRREAERMTNADLEARQARIIYRGGQHNIYCDRVHHWIEDFRFSAEEKRRISIDNKCYCALKAQEAA